MIEMRDGMLDQIAVLLGGRTAEELFCSDITTGASNDLERATTAEPRTVMSASKVVGNLDSSIAVDATAARKRANQVCKRRAVGFCG